MYLNKTQKIVKITKLTISIVKILVILLDILRPTNLFQFLYQFKHLNA
jgi:hypothetical protein